MSKSKYKKYTFHGTYTCGHQGKLRKGGYSYEYAEEAANSEFEYDCPDCRMKELEQSRNEDAQKALKEATEIGLVDLVGSEKQVAWALTIRSDLIKDCENIDKVFCSENIESFRYTKRICNDKQFKRLFDYFHDHCSDEEKKIIEEETIIQIKNNLIYALSVLLDTETSAKFYIDNRYLLSRSVRWGLPIILNHYAKKTEEELFESKMKEEIERESTVLPEEFNDVIVTISTNNEEIMVEMPKDEEARLIVKGFGYRWRDYKWKKCITEFTENTEDRIVELSIELLRKKFGVRLDLNDYEKILDKIKSNDFIEETTRWIKRYDDDHLIIVWRGVNSDLYQKARSIKSSAWNDGVVVPVSQYKKVIDFAEIEGFKFSKQAQSMIDKHINLITTSEKIFIPEKEKEERADKLEEILQKSGMIQDLIDD